jgi:hypothetical protein
MFSLRRSKPHVSNSMALIKVPRPPKKAHDPTRPVTSLLKAQVEHMHEAERQLPLKYRTDTYVKAIRTEADAADYIREVTEAVHEAHTSAERTRRMRERKLEIAAAAEKPRRKSPAKKKGKGRDAKRKRN